MLRDPFTGQPSLPFTLYVMECEGLLKPGGEEEEDEEEDVEQEDQ